MENNLKATIQDLIPKQRTLNAAVEKGAALIEELEAKIDEIVRKKLRTVYATVDYGVFFKMGFRSATWQPKVEIKGVINGGGIFIKVQGQWVYHMGHEAYGKIYPHRIRNRAILFEVQKLEAACAELTEELGIPVVIQDHGLAEVKEDELRTVDDLLVKHTHGKVLAQGKVWYTGWDIADEWVLLQDEVGIHVYFSTNGHGFGFDSYVAPGEDLTAFADFLQQENNKFPSEIKNHLLTSEERGHTTFCKALSSDG